MTLWVLFFINNFTIIYYINDIIKLILYGGSNMFFYHCTYSRNYNSINMHGLQPSDNIYSKSNYKDNEYMKGYVYLALSPEAAEDFFTSSDLYDGSEFIVLKINSDILDFSKIHYDNNDFCENSDDIISIAYEGPIDDEQIGIPGITVMKSINDNKNFKNVEFLDLPYIDTFGALAFSQLFKEWYEKGLEGA